MEINQASDIEEWTVDKLRDLGHEHIQSFRERLTRIRESSYFKKIEIIEKAVRAQIEIIESIFKGGHSHERKARAGKTLTFLLEQLLREYGNLHFSLASLFEAEETEADRQSKKVLGGIQTLLVNSARELSRAFSPVLEIWSLSDGDYAAFTHLEQMYLIRPYRAQLQQAITQWHRTEEIISQVIR